LGGEVGGGWWLVVGDWWVVDWWVGGWRLEVGWLDGSDVGLRVV
jgi:hypothetical protein